MSAISAFAVPSDETKQTVSLAGMSQRSIVLTFSFLVLFALPGLFNGLEFSPFIGAGLVAIPYAFLALLYASGRAWKRSWPFHAGMLFVTLIFVVNVLLFGRAMISDMELVRSTATKLFVSTAMQGALLVAIVSILLSVKDDHRQEVLQRSLVFALVWFCLAQLLLGGLGIEHADKAQIPQTLRPALFLSHAGIDFNRFLFPISTGMTNACVYPLLLASLSLFRLRSSGWSLIWFLLAAALLVMNDSRTYQMALPIALIFWWMSRRFGAAMIVVAAWLPLALFLAVILKASNLIDIASDRYDTYGLFSGREYLWTIFLNYWNVASFGQLFFGNGVYGQVAAGISSSYSFVFAGWNDAGRDLASLHNSYLQFLIDGGLISAVLHIGLIVLVLGRLRLYARVQGRHQPLWRGLMVFLIALLTVCGTEVTITFYGREGFTVFFLVCLLALTCGPEVKQEKVPMAETPANQPLALTL